MKKLSKVFVWLAVLLSDVMCAVVAYSYCNAVWAIKYAGYSAPASVSFYMVIPFVIAIAVCIVVSKILKKKYA